MLGKSVFEEFISEINRNVQKIYLYDARCYILQVLTEYIEVESLRHI